MFSKWSRLFGLRSGKQRPHYPGTVRTAKPRRFVPLVELLERREVPALFLAGPTSSTYGDQVQYTANLSFAGGGPANGTFHLIVDNVEKTAHTVAPSDLSSGMANFTFSLSDLSATTHSIFASYDGDTHGLPDQSSTPISITVARRALTVSATAANRVYDGTTPASVTLSDNRVAGDSFSETFTSAAFADKNAGTGKTVTVSGISLSGPDAGNYILANTTATTTATITHRTATLTGLTANDKVYDGTHVTTVNTANAHIDGVIPADLPDFGFSVSRATGSFSDTNAGTGKTVFFVNAQIGVFAPSAGNYDLAVATGTANITPRPLTVTAAGVNKVYDGTAAASVALSDDRVAGNSFTETFASATFGDKNVGVNKTVTVNGITLSGRDAGNYIPVSNTTSTTATITPRTLHVTAAGVDKVYHGTTDAAVTLSDDRVAGDVLTDSFTTAAFADQNAGTNKPVTVSGIAISGGDAGNYTLANTTATTTATITQAHLTVRASDATRTYGDANPSFGASFSGFVNGESLATSGVAGAPDLTTTATPASPVGTYAIAVAQGSLAAANYDFTFVDGTLTVSEASLTVRADAGSRTYGAANPTFTGTVSGIKNGDAITARFSTDATATSPVGHFAIVPTTVDSPDHRLANYDVTLVNGDLEVTRKDLAITVRDSTKAYGSDNPAFAVDFAGFVLGQDATALGGSLAFSTAANKASGVGAYPVTASGLVSDNYAIKYRPGTLTITPAVLTITADNKAKVYGQANPTLTASFSGFVNGDTAASLTTQPVLSTTAAEESVLGNYPITVSGASSPNYSITYANGTLSIQQVIVQADLATPGKFILLVGGTPGDDHIELKGTSNSLEARLKVNGPGVDIDTTYAGPFSRVALFGGAGNDHLEVEDRVTVPAWLSGGSGDDHLQAGGGLSLLFGGTGNDHLEGGKGGSVLVGGDGDDHLNGGAGRNILIGGRCTDHLNANSGDDILIGGSTAFDANETALTALLAEWTRTDADYATRVAHLTSGGGLNGAYRLSADTVHDDSAIDRLEGGSGKDLYFASDLDLIAGKRSDEVVIAA
jgi:hypothetical protein